MKNKKIFLTKEQKDSFLIEKIELITDQYSLAHNNEIIIFFCITHKNGEKQVFQQIIKAGDCIPLNLSFKIINYKLELNHD